MKGKFKFLALTENKLQFIFSRVKVCMVVGYGHNEGDDEEGRDSAMTWVGLWIHYEMGTAYVF